jgi:CRP-like cAMP-binding protein
VAVALTLRDMLWLRTLWSSAQMIMIMFAAISNEPVMMAWNFLFLSINSYQVVRIVLERRDIKLPSELEYLYESVFSIMSKREFLKFWAMGGVRDVEDTMVIKHGEAQKEVCLVMNGTVSVRKGKNEIARLGKSIFFGEMSFLTGLPATADVVAEGKVRFNAWDQRRLREMRDGDPDLFIKVQTALSKDLMRKLQHELADQTLY